MKRPRRLCQSSVTGMKKTLDIRILCSPSTAACVASERARSEVRIRKFNSYPPNLNFDVHT